MPVSVSLLVLTCCLCLRRGAGHKQHNGRWRGGGPGRWRGRQRTFETKAESHSAGRAVKGRKVWGKEAQAEAKQGESRCAGVFLHGRGKAHARVLECWLVAWFLSCDQAQCIREVAGFFASFKPSSVVFFSFLRWQGPVHTSLNARMQTSMCTACAIPFDNYTSA